MLMDLYIFREKMEDLEEKITEEQQRKKSAEEKLQAQNKLLIGLGFIPDSWRILIGESHTHSDPCRVM